ncbi:DNA primase [Phycicoccus ginsengisoli]
MAGRIKTDDIALVKERSSIEDVVREHVTLRPAGPGSMKGLCPFHDEKTPSFNIRPAVGAWHCFGCGEGGDVISFVQKVEHLTFTEAIERLAAKLGLELHYEEGGRPRDGETLGRRSRLVEAHRAAQEFYLERLLESQEARIGRDFLRERGFGGDAARRFGVGFAPRGGEELSRYLRGKGFSEEELVLGGLSGRGSRGVYDRFRGRLVWPIRDITGDTVGFGARRLYDDDRIAAKYLNTSETPIYKKSTVLYGLDLAKKAIAAERKAIVVEGYTDVMACHLAGIEGAVASCGTAFGVDHIKVLRRIMRDEADLAPARVVFTFDGDAAGQKAAMKAFTEDQRWASQSFVAVAEGGMDPCELRIAQGDDAVRHLVDDAVPMFEFAVRTTINRFDMSTAEGRVQAMRAAAPIVNSIRDSSMRPEYVRTVAGWIGVEVEQVQAEVARAGRMAAREAQKESGPGAALPDAEAVPEPSEQEARAALPPPDLRDPVVVNERELLQALLQFPDFFTTEDIDSLPPSAFSAPAHRAVFDGIRTAGGPQPGLSSQAWADRVADAATLAVRGLVAELAVAELRVVYDKATGRPRTSSMRALLIRIQEVTLTRKIADAMSAMRRMAADQHSDPARARALSSALQDLQRELAQLRDKAS